jgi:DNA-directed RNA polymerase specialized sigma24 family protein
MSTIEQTKAPFAEVPIADFVDIILDGGERADEAMYYLLQHILYLPLRRRYETVQHLLFDDFDDILNDFFFHLRDGSTIGCGHNRTAEETGGNVGDVHYASDYQRSYPSLRRIRNRQAFVQWMLHTFRNYLLMRTAKETPPTLIEFDPDSAHNADASPSILTDEQKLSFASDLLAYAHQELPPRDGFILLRSLLTMLDKRQALPNEEMAEALGMTDVTYRVTVHRVKDRLTRYRAHLLQGKPIHLDEPHRRMAQRINEDFLHLYPTLLYYYTLSINSLDPDRANAVNRLRQDHLAKTGDLFHEPAVSYGAKYSKAVLWNLMERFLDPE